MTTRKFPPAVSRSNAAPPERAASIVPRRFLRAAVNLPAQYTVEGNVGWRASIIDDLGGGGVRLQTQEDIAAGTLLSLRFVVDATPIHATARVAMSLFDKSRACFIHGVAFTTIDPDAQETIVRRVVALRAAQLG